MATIKPLTAPAKRLAATITGSATAFQVNDIEGWNGSNLSSSDFGTKAYAAFRNSAGTLLELMEIDPSTIASASITIVRRGLKFNGDDLTTEVSGNKLTWVKGDTIIEFGSHFPQLLAHYVDILADQTIAGIKTFSVAPKSSADGLLSTELIRKSQLDAAVLGSLTLSPVVEPGTGGATLSVDQGVYQDPADGKWKLWDADTAATVNNVRLGITRGACASDGSAITGGVTVSGLHVASSAIFTANTKYFASNTAGGFSTSAGTTEVTVGFAISTTQFALAPRYDQQLTENQQDLIAAIEGGTDFYAASAVGTDAYAITIAPPITAYVTGMKFRFKADVANTGPCTLAVSGLSALAIKKNNDQDTATGDIEAGQIVEVVYDGTDFQMQSQVATSVLVDVQTFTTAGTTAWTKPSGAKVVEVYLFGAGAGGGSGAAQNSDAHRPGGTGGGAGAFAYKKFTAAGLGATEDVVIGAGGAGGTAVTTGNSGNDGVDGGSTSFGTTLLLRALGGTKGVGGGLGNSGGQAGGAGGVVANGDITQAGGAGGASISSGAGTAGAASSTVVSPRGGGGGGSVNNTNSGFDGAAGGAFTTYYAKAGGTAGVTATPLNGGIGNASNALLFGGTGGGGGAGNTGGAGGTGGAGISGGGGGGGGGGRNGNSGAGGAGGDGLAVVITYF